MAHKHAVSQFDGIVAGPEAEYATLIEKTEPPDGHKGVQGHVRITRMAKIVFGWGFCAENMFDVAGDTLLTKFYNDHLGVQVYWLSMATFVAGIAGALCQLWLGYVGDRFESRWGRRRPFIVVMSLFAGAAIIALMFPPAIVTHGGYAAPWFFILFTILEIARETTELSYDSLGTEVTQDEEERSELYAYQAGMGVVGILFVAGGNAILSYATTEAESFKILGLGIGLLSTGGNIFLAWYIKENPAFKEQGAMPLVPGFRSCMANKPWILLAWCNGLLRMINEFSGLYPFVISYCLKRDQDTWLAVGVCLMAFTRLLGVPFVLKLTSRYGKIPAFVVSLIVCAVSGVLTFFSLFIESPYPFCITLGILGFGFAGTGMAVNIMLSDTIDYDELHTGKRRESTYHSITGVPQETLSVLARAGPLIVLYLLGFKDDGGLDHNSQNKNVEFALKAMAGGIPLVVSLVSLLLLQWYNIDEEVHAKIMKAIQRRAKGEAYGITDPLTGEPVIPLEKTPDMAVELTMKEGGAVGERVGLLSGGDPPMHALGTYMLFFADKEVRLIKNGGRWFFLAKYVLSILFWSMNLILSAYAAGDMLTRHGGNQKERAANYAYISILIATFCGLALIFEAMRFGGVRWLVTMSPSVVAKVIRRRRRILRATHKLMTEQAANVKPGGGTLKKSLRELDDDNLRGPATFVRSNSLSRTLLDDDSEGSGNSASSAPGVHRPSDDGEHYHKETLKIFGWVVQKESRSEKIAREHRAKLAERSSGKSSNQLAAGQTGLRRRKRCTTVWHSANSVKDPEDADGDSDEDTDESVDSGVLEELEKYNIVGQRMDPRSRSAAERILASRKDRNLVALSGESKRSGPPSRGESGGVPTLMPSKVEIEPLPPSALRTLIRGEGLTPSQKAAREIMRTMLIKFVILHFPILVASIVLNISSLTF